MIARPTGFFVFRKIEITKGFIKSTIYVYKNGKGPYKNVGQVFEEVIQIGKKNGFQVDRAAGMYFDDPNVTASEELRWSAGFLVGEEEAQGIKHLIWKNMGCL